MTTFTGRPGNVNASPETFVPMFGAGGTKYAKALTGQLSFIGSIVTATTRAFHNLSLSVYRAVYRAYARWNTYSIEVLGDSPVGYWRLGDPVGAVTAYDLSGFGGLGTIVGGVTAGVSGGLLDASTAMQFDGSSGYIGVGNNITKIFNNKQPFSIEALMFPTAATAFNAIFGSSSSGATDSTLHVLRRNDIAGVNIAWFGFYNDDLPGNTVLTLNRWWHLVFVFNGSKRYIYVNGQQDATDTPTGTLNIGTQNLEIGRIFQGSYCTGDLQEVAIYSYALTPQQIATHYTAMITYPSAGFTTNLRTSQ